MAQLHSWWKRADSSQSCACSSPGPQERRTARSWPGRRGDGCGERSTTARQIWDADDGARDPAEVLGLYRGRACARGLRRRDSPASRIDDEVLPLSVMNSNLKAQRLSFGPAREAADGVRRGTGAGGEGGAGGNPWRAQALAARGVSAVREIQVLQAPRHRRSRSRGNDQDGSTDGRLDAGGARAVQQVRGPLIPSAAAALADAVAALNRFGAINKELIVLSRRNSDVHSLAPVARAQARRHRGRRGSCRRSRTRSGSLRVYGDSCGRQRRMPLEPPAPHRGRAGISPKAGNGAIKSSATTPTKADQESKLADAKRPMPASMCAATSKTDKEVPEKC